MFDLARSGHVYSRISNPTVAVLEERIAGLEGGTGAVATASGMAAIHLALCTIMDGGSHIVSSHALYGGTHNLFTYTLPRFGINTTFVDPREPDAFKRAIRPETRLIYAETIGNPRCEVLDIETIAGIAHDAQIPLMLDSTLTTPYLLQTLRPRRRYRSPFPHQVYRWARHRHRRHHRGFRPLRLGCFR